MNARTVLLDLDGTMVDSAAGITELAVATSKPESLAQVIVADNGLAGYFEVIAGADHVRGRTGKAAVVGSVLERLVFS